MSEQSAIFRIKVSMVELMHGRLISTLVFFLFIAVFSDKLREIRLQGFLPMTGLGWPIGGACLPATLMAVRHVNEREGLLDGYNVSYTWADSMVI